MAVVLAIVLSGLFGTVTRSPTMPVCVAGQPCSKPAAGVTLTFMRRGTAVKSVVTSQTGTYRVRLPAGIYVVRLTTRSRIQRLKPSAVTVPHGVMAHRNFVIDTGIR
jgi:hypothetical protein